MVKRRSTTPEPNGKASDAVSGKAVIVTGGTTGIGRATAVLLAARGARVLIFGRHEPELETALSEIKLAGGDGYGLIADQSRLHLDFSKSLRCLDGLAGVLDKVDNDAAKTLPIGHDLCIRAPQVGD